MTEWWFRWYPVEETYRLMWEAVRAWHSTLSWGVTQGCRNMHLISSVLKRRPLTCEFYLLDLTFPQSSSYSVLFSFSLSCKIWGFHGDVAEDSICRICQVYLFFRCASACHVQNYKWGCILKDGSVVFAGSGYISLYCFHRRSMLCKHRIVTRFLSVGIMLT
jgi:hypothetical protein